MSGLTSGRSVFTAPAGLADAAVTGNDGAAIAASPAPLCGAVVAEPSRRATLAPPGAGRFKVVAAAGACSGATGAVPAGASGFSPSSSLTVTN